MLRLILGRSGCGKTEYLKTLFADLAQKGEDKLLFLVPDQITFETEADFLDRLGPALSRNILVLGFSRLCDYVFEQTGHRYANFADEGVRHMVMSMALEQVSDQLTAFQQRSRSRDLCDVMLTAVKEYKQCGVSPDDLRAVSGSVGDQTLRQKLLDTALVCDAYHAVMAQSYMDPLDSLTKLSDILTDVPVFRDYFIAMDGFYGFTAQEYAVIEPLMEKSREYYVALTDDGAQGGDTSLFYAPRRTRARLCDHARRRGVPIAPYEWMREPRRFSDPLLPFGTARNIEVKES